MKISNVGVAISLLTRCFLLCVFSLLSATLLVTFNISIYLSPSQLTVDRSSLLYIPPSKKKKKNITAVKNHPSCTYLNLKKYLKTKTPIKKHPALIPFHQFILLNAFGGQPFLRPPISFRHSPHTEVPPILELLNNLPNGSLDNTSQQLSAQNFNKSLFDVMSTKIETQRSSLARSNSSHQRPLKSKSKVRASASTEKYDYDRVEIVIQDGVVNVISDREAQV